MRLIHFSDTHLGHGDYNKLDSETGINQREADIYKVFRDIIDYIIDVKPDLVIHAGDLFDNVRPSNKAISVALQQFARLSKEKIPTVVIAGNHSTPRQRSKETIFKILDYFDNLHPVYEGKYRKIPIGECAIHAIPHTYSDQDLVESVKQAKPDKKFKYNILATHGRLKEVQEASWGEFKEQTIPQSILSSGFDYIALGHIHSFHKLSDKAYYCGSPERLSFNEVDQKKCFLDVEINPKTTVKQIPTDAREMKVFDTVDCASLTPEEIVESIRTTVEGNIDNKIAGMTFDNIPRHVYSSLDHSKIQEITQSAIYFYPIFKFHDEETGKASTTSKIGSLDEEYEAFLHKKGFVDEEFLSLKTLGLDYLHRVRQEETVE